MANESDVVSTSQLRSLMSPSSVESYGLVKVMTDEQLDEYLSGGSEADNDSITLGHGSDINYSSFGFVASCNGGTVTISGSSNVNNQSLTPGGKYVIFTLPRGYRPASIVSSRCTVYYGTSGISMSTLTLYIDTNGEAYFTHDDNRQSVAMIQLSNVSFSANPEEAQEPDGIYVVTVQQAIRYLSQISGGGDSGDNETVLWEGNASQTPYIIDVEGLNGYDEIKIEVQYYGQNIEDSFVPPYHSGQDSVSGYAQMLIVGNKNVYLQSNSRTSILKVIGVRL